MRTACIIILLFKIVALTGYSIEEDCLNHLQSILNSSSLQHGLSQFDMHSLQTHMDLWNNLRLITDQNNCNYLDSMCKQLTSNIRQNTYRQSYRLNSQESINIYHFMNILNYHYLGKFQNLMFQTN